LTQEKIKGLTMIQTLLQQTGKKLETTPSTFTRSISKYSQPQIADSFYKSSAQKVEDFKSVFNQYKPQLEAWKAQVSIERSLFGKKKMTINYGENVKALYSHRDLEAALAEGEKFSELSKSLPKGAQAFSERPDQIELYLPGRESAIFTDQSARTVWNGFEEGYRNYDRLGKDVDKFAEAKKLIEQFKANKG
jgi:hypothetical protein